MNTRDITDKMNPENIRKARHALVKGYTEWAKFVGTFVLLLADVWLGAQVLQYLGVDTFTAYLISAAVSALQIALFDRSKHFTDGKRGWNLGWGYVFLISAWGVSIADSLIDGSAIFIWALNDLPTTLSDFGEIKSPYVWTIFVILSYLSFLGERSAHMLLAEEESRSMGYIPESYRPAGLWQEPNQPLVTPTYQPKLRPAPRPATPVHQAEETSAAYPYRVPKSWRVVAQPHRTGSFTIFPPSGTKKMPVNWSPGQPDPFDGAGLGEPGFGGE